MMYENIMRNSGYCLPNSVNKEVIKLKKLNKRITIEIARQPNPKRLIETLNEVNLLIQKLRQLESDFVKSSNTALNIGRKQHNYNCIIRSNINELTLTLGKSKTKKDHGLTVAKGDIWKHKLNNNANYIVESIGIMSDSTYIVTMKETPLYYCKEYKQKYIALTIDELYDDYYLYDVEYGDY